MGLSKAYDELTDNPEFSDGLTITTGNGIIDESGTERYGLSSTGTFIRDNLGRPVFESYSSSSTQISAFDGNPVKIIDADGGFTAVEYNTSSSAPGTLELTNANLVTAGSNEFTIYGDVSEDPEPGYGGGLATTNGNGSGFWERNGEPVFLGRDTSLSNAIHFILGESGVDREEKIRLTPDALELTDAQLLSQTGYDIGLSPNNPGVSNNAGIRWADQGGGTDPRIDIDGRGEIRARDDDGNVTRLT